MKINNPKSRSDLSIRKEYHVLEVGPGNFPHYRANVIADRFIASNYHRSGNLKILKNQVFVEADGQDLPFKNQEFDYVICCHVLEHVEDPVKFLKEQTRVASLGYLETPSIIGEYLMPKESHRWVIQEIDNKIIMYEKEEINFKTCPDMSYIFQDYLPKNSIGFKIMNKTHPNLTIVNYEWKDNIDVLVNPDSSYYKEFFTQPFTETMCNTLYKKKSMETELLDTFHAFGSIVKSVVNSKFLKK
jgi:SAM-dependent methyltransferase